VYQNMRMSVILRKLHGSSMTDKNERREYDLISSFLECENFIEINSISNEKL
jgi:hypothetical protein